MSINYKNLSSIFFPIAILLLSVIVCLTFVFTGIFENILEDFLLKTYISNLYIIKENYTRLQHTFIPTAFDVYENDNVQDYLFARYPNREAALHALKFMDKAAVLNPYIHSFYAYNSDYGYLSTFAGYEGVCCISDPDLNDFLINKDIYPGQIYLRTINRNGKTVNFYTVVLGKKNLESGIHYAFIMNICESCIRKELNAASKIDCAELCIINAENIIVSNKEADKIGSHTKTDSMLAAVMLQEEKEGTITVFDPQGNKYFAAWSDQSEIAWRFLYFIPHTVIFKIITDVRNTGLLISFFIFFTATCVTIILTVKLERKFTAEKKLYNYCFGYVEFSFSAFFRNENIYLAVCRFDPCKKERELLQKAVEFINQNKKHDIFFIQFDGNKWIVLMQKNFEGFKTKLFEIKNKMEAEYYGSFTGVFFETISSFADIPTFTGALISKLQHIYMLTSGVLEPVTKEPLNYVKTDSYIKYDFSNFETAFREKRVEIIQQEIKKLDEFLVTENNFFIFRTCIIQIMLIVAKIWDETLDILLPNGIDAWRKEVFAVERISCLISKLTDLEKCILKSLELELNTHKTKIVRHIKNYIMDNIRNKNLNSALVADSLGLSLNYVREMFKTAEKKSINDYIGLYRVELAKQLLIETKESVYAICDEVGFSNYSYFCTYFKKMECISPGKFRLNMHISK